MKNRFKMTTAEIAKRRLANISCSNCTFFDDRFFPHQCTVLLSGNVKMTSIKECGCMLWEKSNEEEE